MNKTELISAVAQRTGMTRRDAEQAISASLDIITAQLAAGEKVQLSGFGIFETKTRSPRLGRNPLTKESIQIPASTAPVFKASKALKDAVAK